MTAGKLELSGGVVSAHVPARSYMDAAIAAGNTVAGIELAIEDVRVHVGGNPNEQRAWPVLALGFDGEHARETMEQLATLLMTTLGWERA